LQPKVYFTAAAPAVTFRGSKPKCSSKPYCISLCVVGNGLEVISAIWPRWLDELRRITLVLNNVHFRSEGFGDSFLARPDE
jgi:hypothetical protein